MRCHTARVLMTRRLHAALSHEEGDRLAAHLQSCAACRAELERDSYFETDLRRGIEAERAALSAPAGIDPDHVLRYLRGAQRGRARTSGRLLRSGIALALGATACGAVLHYRNGRPSSVQVANGGGAHSGTRTAPAGPDTQATSGGSPTRNTPSAANIGTRHGLRIAADHAPPHTPSKATNRKPIAAPNHPIQPDERYFDGRDPDLILSWTSHGDDQAKLLRLLRQPLPPTADDFVSIPLPRIAGAHGEGAADAIKQYDEERKVVDARLFHKVTLHCKAMPLDDFCKELSHQTGVKIEASRGVRDEKVTVFVEERPARDVMREVARLFGYLFARSGEPMAYRYELLQDLRSQLAEEEMRARDVHEALIALDEEMGQFRPFLQEDIGRMLDRVNRNKDGKDLVANKLFRFVKGGGWGPAQLYFRLSPADRTKLIDGEELHFRLNDSNPDRRLPDEWRQPLLKTSGLHLYGATTIIEQIDPSKPSTPVDQLPDMQPEVQMHLDRSEAGVVSLQVGTQVYQIVNGEFKSAGGSVWELANGKNPSTENPDNAKANAVLKSDPHFQEKIELAPTPSCKRSLEDAERKKKGIPPDQQFILEQELREPHVNSADVWEEIHHRTGFPIVADSYTHLFPLSKLTTKNTTTFDAVCQAGDRMGVRWKKDGEFLLGRSTAYFWDKLKEVPNRALQHWVDDRDRLGSLPLEDLIEMSTLTDAQLGSHTVGLGITHCWNLDEWGIIGGGPFIGGVIIPSELRKQVRSLTVLTPGQLAQALKPEGLSARALTLRQLEPVEQRLSWSVRDVQNANNFHVEYIPRGWYVWEPLITQQRYEAEGKNWPHVAAPSAERALAEARKYDPEAMLKDVHWTRGEFNLVQIDRNGRWLGPGGVRVLSPLE